MEKDSLSGGKVNDRLLLHDSYLQKCKEELRIFFKINRTPEIPDTAFCDELIWQGHNAAFSETVNVMFRETFTTN